LTIRVYDLTKVYFGDYHHVRIKIACYPDKVTAGWGQCTADSIDTGNISYIRTLEKMGVPSVDIENVKNDLLNDFKVNSIPYLSSPDFPQKMIEKELSKKVSPARKYQGAVS
jgi:hypothetical protein